MKKLLVVAAALLLFVVPAMADNYVKGGVGYFMPAESGYDSGYSLEVAYGVPLQDIVDLPLTAELGLGYYTASSSVSGNEVGFSYKLDEDFSVTPITATALYELPIDVSNMIFNIGAGLGLYMWNLDGTIKFDDGSSGSLSSDGNEFGFHLQADADYKLNDQLVLVAGLKWLSVKAKDEAVGIDTKIGGTIINVGAKFKF